MSLVARRPSPFPGNETILCNNDVSMANGQINFMFAQGYRRNCTGKRFPSSSINNSSTHSLTRAFTHLASCYGQEFAFSRGSRRRKWTCDVRVRVRLQGVHTTSNNPFVHEFRASISRAKKMCTFHLMQLHYDSILGPTSTCFDAQAE